MAEYRYRQRGFNLVELGIILAVVGLLLGASLVPLSRLWEGDFYRQERDTLRAVQNSIIGYALTHSNVAAEVVVEGATATRRYQLPGGRPYLPCPDVDGDGYEDRLGDRIPGVFAFAASYTISPAENPLMKTGNCLISRGNLPWKTLGVPAADQWGNRYTYQVDDVFSNAVVGFNQETIADSFDYRLTVSLNSGNRMVYQRRRFVDLALTVTVNGVEEIFYNPRAPVVICNENNSYCRPPDTSAMPITLLNLAAGDMAAEGFSAGRRDYQPNDVIEGIVYAVISHGSNGYGAINHIVNSVVYEQRCNYPVDTINTGGVYNVSNDFVREVVNFPYIGEGLPINLRYCLDPIYTDTGQGAGIGFLNVQPRSSNLIYSPTQPELGGPYDDVVVWAMRQEVVRTLTEAKQLPARDLPLFRAY